MPLKTIKRCQQQNLWSPWFQLFLGWHLCINSLLLNLTAQHPIPNMNTSSKCKLLTAVKNGAKLTKLNFISLTYDYVNCVTSSFLHNCSAKCIYSSVFACALFLRGLLNYGLHSVVTQKKLFNLQSTNLVRSPD